MWSFNREGECDENLKRDREQAMGLDSSEANRAARQSFLDLAGP